MSESLLFYFWATLTIIPALIVVFSSNIIYAAFSLLVSLFGVAVLFVMLYADFLAVVQITLYVGGILVLILFGVLLTRKIYSTKASSPQSNSIKIIFCCLMLGLFVSLLLKNIVSIPWNIQEVKDFQSTVEPIGMLLFDSYILPFELAAILLLAALNGAVYLSRGIKKHES